MQGKAYSEEVIAGLDQARAQISWIRENLVGIELKGDHRHRIPAQLFDLAIEHGSGIHNLIAANICASAFALVRSEFECFVRGAWLYHCASDAEIETFIAKDRIDPTFGALIEAVEEKPEFDSKFLSTVKDSAMKAMHGWWRSSGLPPDGRRLYRTLFRGRSSARGHPILSNDGADRFRPDRRARRPRRSYSGGRRANDGQALRCHGRLRGAIPRPCAR